MTLKQFQNSLQTPDGGYYVTLTDGAGNLAPASGGSVTTEAQANATSQTWTEGTDNPLSVDLSGNLRVIDKNSAAALTALTAATPAGTNLIGKVGIDQTTNGTTNNVTTDGVADAVVSSASVSSAAVGATFSTAGYGCMSFQIIANASGNTISFEGSNDGGTTWGAIAGRIANQTSLSGNQGSTLSTAVVGTIIEATLVSPIMRWRVSSFIGGTTTVATGMKRSQSPNVVEAFVGNTITSALTSSSTSGGISTTGRLASAANSTNGTSLATGAHRIYNIQALNVAAAPRYLVLYDTASAPTVGTTTIRKKIPIPANSAIAIDFVLGISFANGIAYALTVNAADADATAVTAGDILQLNIDYV